MLNGFWTVTFSAPTDVGAGVVAVNNEKATGGDTAVIRPDTRQDYGEARYQAFGLIGRRLYFMAFSLRSNAVRVVSLRKANSREVSFYKQETQSSAN